MDHPTGGMGAGDPSARLNVPSGEPSRAVRLTEEDPMPLFDVFWTTLMIFCWVAWFLLLFRVYGDLFSRDDIGGGAKTVWVVVTLFLPFLGVFVYLITQGRSMAERAQEAIERQRAASDDYIRSVAADAEAERLGKARSLVQSGAITPEELERLVPQARS
jgi:hypothetical protein